MSTPEEEMGDRMREQLDQIKKHGDRIQEVARDIGDQKLGQLQETADYLARQAALNERIHEIDAEIRRLTMREIEHGEDHSAEIRRLERERRKLKKEFDKGLNRPPWWSLRRWL